MQSDINSTHIGVGDDVFVHGRIVGANRGSNGADVEVMPYAIDGRVQREAQFTIRATLCKKIAVPVSIDPIPLPSDPNIINAPKLEGIETVKPVDVDAEPADASESLAGESNTKKES